MSFLARGTESNHAHDKVLGGHKWELFTDTTCDDGRVDDEAGDNVVKDSEKNVGCEEGMGDINAADGAAREGGLVARERATVV